MQNVTMLDLLVVIGYLVGIAWLGILQNKRIKSAGDFFAGGRVFNKWLMLTHALGSGTHADDPVGVAGAAYQHGISGIWYTYVYLFLTPFYWIIAPFFRRSRYLTTADFFDARFGRSLGLLYSLMGVLTFAVNMGTLLKGTGAIISAVTQNSLPEWMAIGAMTLIFVAYGFAGGIVATVMTEFIQGLLIIVMSLLIIPFGLAQIGGFAGLHRLLPADKFNLAAPQEITWIWILTATLINLIGIVAQPHIMEVCSTGKSEFEGRIGFTYGSFIKRICALGWMLTGLIVLALVQAGQIDGQSLTHQREAAFGVGIRELLPAGFVGLMFASILAAQMSTLSAFMVAGSALITRNLYQKYFAPQASEPQVLRWARLAGLLEVGLGLIFCYLVAGVAEALTFFWGLSSLTGVFIWAGVLSRRVNATGAWISFICMSLIWGFLGPLGEKLLHPLFPSIEWLGMFADKAHLPQLVLAYLPVGILALVIGSYLGKPWPAAVLAKFFQLIRTPVGKEHELSAAGITTLYNGASIGHPWELKYPKLVHWGGFVIGFLFALSILGVLFGLTFLGK
ncbi:sodium:solute symporter family protein [candidate division KSB1 bacterium]|nr:sodium:solute symporter family protein [candidate division KSB1 bacterium]